MLTVRLEILSALSALHACCIIQCDFKPTLQGVPLGAGARQPVSAIHRASRNLDDRQAEFVGEFRHRHQEVITAARLDVWPATRLACRRTMHGTAHAMSCENIVVVASDRTYRAPGGEER